MKINGSEVKTIAESKQSKKDKQAKKSSGNTSAVSSKKQAASDDGNTLTPQGIIGLVITAVLIVCIVIAVVLVVGHIGKNVGGSAKADKNQTVAEQLNSGNSSSNSSSSPTDEETFPGLTSDTSKNDDVLKEWEKKSSDEGDEQGAEYYKSLQGTGLKKDDGSSDDAYAKIASGVVSDIKTLSCDAFYAKYNKVSDKNCEAYGTIQDAAKKEEPKSLDRYSDNTETWFSYSMDKSDSGFTVYVSKDSVVSDVSFAFESPLE